MPPKDHCQVFKNNRTIKLTEKCVLHSDFIRNYQNTSIRNILHKTNGIIPTSIRKTAELLIFFIQSYWKKQWNEGMKIVSGLFLWNLKI
jgi:hypothetical protein